MQFGTTKIGAEDSERALLASQGPSLRAKEPRKDSPPAAPEAWTGWPDRQARQGARPITEKKGWARDQWVLRNAQSGSHAPKTVKRRTVAGAPKARGRGGPGGGERKSPEPEIGEGAGGDHSARQYEEGRSPPCSPTLGTEARAGPGGRARAKGGPSIRTGATARRPSPAPQALP